jgi:LDH2 family malate/lactate/ureidoglycolate dehydrogenase
MVVFQSDQWRRIGRALFKAAGATDVNAERVTEALVVASLVGHDSHGIIRFVQYVKDIEQGYLDPAAKPEIIKETETTTFVDGKWTFGQVSAETAMRKAIEKAKKHGIAISGLIRAYHIGRLGEYSEMARNDGMIAMVMSSGFAGAAGSKSANVAPFGGARSAFGTNPISFGIPAGDKPGVLVDFATSVVAGGKISLARAKGVPLPEGCILDKEGKPTTNPEDFYEGGMLLAFGAHKGSGLAVVIELLGQVLTGSELCQEESFGGGVFNKSGSSFVAIDPTIFRPFADFASATDKFIDKIKNIPPAPGFKEVLFPGEPEQRTRIQRTNEGIPLVKTSWQSLQQLAVKYGVDLITLLR